MHIIMDSFMKQIIDTTRCTMLYRCERLSGGALNGHQCSYILHICSAPGLTQDQLAARLFADKSCVARQVAQLAQNGFITRRPCPSDGRAVEIFPTEKALEILPHVREIFSQWNEYLTEDLTDAEKAELSRLMGHLQEKAKRYAEDMRPRWQGAEQTPPADR